MKIVLDLYDFNPVQLDVLHALLTEVMICQEGDETAEKKRIDFLKRLGQIEWERKFLVGEPIQPVTWWKSTY